MNEMRNKEANAINNRDKEGMEDITLAKADIFSLVQLGVCVKNKGFLEQLNLSLRKRRVQAFTTQQIALPGRAERPQA